LKLAEDFACSTTSSGGTHEKAVETVSHGTGCPVCAPNELLVGPRPHEQIPGPAASASGGIFSFKDIGGRDTELAAPTNLACGAGPLATAPSERTDLPAGTPRRPKEVKEIRSLFYRHELTESEVNGILVGTGRRS